MLNAVQQQKFEPCHLNISSTHIEAHHMTVKMAQPFSMHKLYQRTRYTATETVTRRYGSTQSRDGP